MKNHLSFLAITALLLSAGIPMPAQAATAGDLIKCDDFSSVYYLAEDGNRYVFPNEKIYYSWYPDFVDVKTVSCEDLATITLGDRIVYQAGTRLVKLPSAPTVYAVEDNGVLRPIASEEQAIALYGDDWAERVDDLSEAFWSSFTVGEELDDDEIPDGTIIKDDNGDLFRMDNGEVVEINAILDTDDEDVLDDHAIDHNELEARIGITVALTHVTAEQAVTILTELLEELKAVHVDDDEKVEVPEFDEDEEDELDQVIDAGDAIADAREEIADAEADIAEDAADGKDVSESEDYLSDAIEHLAEAETAYGKGAYTDAEAHADEAKHAAMWARGKAVDTIKEEDSEEEDDDDQQDEEDVVTEELNDEEDVGDAGDDSDETDSERDEEDTDDSDSDGEDDE